MVRLGMARLAFVLAFILLILTSCSLDSGSADGMTRGAPEVGVSAPAAGGDPSQVMSGIAAGRGDSPAMRSELLADVGLPASAGQKLFDRSGFAAEWGREPVGLSGPATEKVDAGAPGVSVSSPAVVPGDDDVSCPDPEPGSWLMTDPWGMTFRKAEEQVRLSVRLHHRDGRSDYVPVECGVSFHSSAPGFVAVDRTGLLRAVAVGESAVRVAYRDLDAEILANLRPRPRFAGCDSVMEAGPATAYRVIQRSDGSEAVVNRVMVKLAGVYTRERALAVACRRGGLVALEFSGISWFVMWFEGRTLADLESMLAALNADPDVAIAEPEYIVGLGSVDAPHQPSTERDRESFPGKRSGRGRRWVYPRVCRGNPGGE